MAWGPPDLWERVRPQAQPCYSLGFPPWGAASPGAGSDLHDAHVQTPAKMKRLHSTPTIYTRKVWSVASAQLLLGPCTPLGASVGRQEKQLPLKAHPACSTSTEG